MNTSVPNAPFARNIALALGVVILIGFARTYFLSFVFEQPDLPWFVHVHGALCTLWIILFYAQAVLIAADRRDLHRLLGTAMVALAALLVGQGLVLAANAAAHGHAPPGRDPLQFMSVSMGFFFTFGTLVALGAALRRRREWHKRLMLLATLVMLAPAVGRLQSLFDQHVFRLPRASAGFIIISIFLLWACLNDLRRRGRIHPAYLIGGPALLASIPLGILVGKTQTWLRFAQWLTERVNTGIT